MSHGINYGRGPAAIARQTGADVDEVAAMHAAYFERFAGIRAWHETVRGQARAGDPMGNGFGRVVRVPAAEAYTEAPARLAQSAARDCAMRGLLALADAELPARLRLFVHDEFVLSCREEDVDEVLERAVDLVSFGWQSPSGLEVPVVAEPGKGWGPRWSDVYRRR